MSDHVQSVSDDNFEKEVLESQIPVVVDFWAEWCGPCKAFAPTFEDVAQKYTDKVKFVKLNVDQNPSAPQKFGVRGIPTMILFKDGQVKATQVGALNKADFVKFVDNHI